MIQLNIEAQFAYENELFECSGTISAKQIREDVFYATWSFFNSGGQFSMSRSRSYFIDGNVAAKESELIEKIIADIEKYRIDRKRVFSEVRVIA